MSSKTPKVNRKKIVLARKTTNFIVVIIVALLFVALTVFALHGSSGEDVSPITQEQNTLAAEENDKDRLLCVRVSPNDSECLYAETAVTPAELQRGLSGRDNLLHNHGMLFDFRQVAEHCMWMPDMAFAIDIVWLDTDQRIVTIKPDIAPETYPESFCGESARYVLEVNSGVVAERGWRIGEQLLW